MNPDPGLIFETRYWTIKHRSDSRYPGYLIMLSKETVFDIHKLSSESLAEMSIVLAAAEKLLTSVYEPYKVIIFKMGFAKGVYCHFNLVPVTEALLLEIEQQKACTHAKPDGSDAVLYVCRKYCERDLTLPEQKELLATVEMLKVHYQNSLKE